MRKFVPYLFCGLAAVSFSTFAQTSGRSVDTGGGTPDSSKATGTVPQAGTSSTMSGSATTGASGSVNTTQQGRSVDTGGARPDSSKAEGAAPVTSPSTNAGASAGASTDTTATGEKPRKAKRAKRDTTSNRMDPPTTGSRDAAANPGGRGGPNTGAGAGSGSAQ
jgi:hypothetical protein